MRFPANLCLLKINERNTKKMCEIYLNLIIKTIVRNSTASVTKLGTYFTHFSSVSIVELAQVNVCWVWFGKIIVVTQILFLFNFIFYLTCCG